MRRCRLVLLAIVVAAGVAWSAHAATGTTYSSASADEREQARAAEVAPSTPRDVLLTERTVTTVVRRLTSDRNEPRSENLAAALAVIAGLALLALGAGGRLHLSTGGAHDAAPPHRITARGPPLRLA